MRMQFMLSSTILGLAALGVACGGGDKAPAKKKGDDKAPTAALAKKNPEKKPAVAAGDAAAKEAEQLWSTLCVTCHGKTGAGDGPGAAALNPKPRSFGDAAWQAATTDERIGKVIIGGGPAVGLSPLMTPNPQLKAKPEVLAELVKKIRAFKK